MTLLGRVRGVVNGKLCVADDLEASLAEGDAWFSSLKTRMDEYAEKNGILPFEERPEEKPASAVAPSATEAHALLELGTPYGRR